MPENALFCPKKAEYGAVFPQKIFLDMIIPNRDNSGINHRQGCSGPRFAVEIYTFHPMLSNLTFSKKATI